MLWRDEIVEALRALGGQATLTQIYNQIEKTSGRSLALKWKDGVRKEMHICSSDSASDKKRHDLFYKLNKHVQDGIWGLRESEAKTPIAPDSISSPPDRVLSEIYRILRDTVLARRIKNLHNHECQICGKKIILRDGSFYSEAHHIRPLGDPHNGPDVPENILVLCPNHHVECDYGVIPLSIETLRDRHDHVVSQAYIDYHNKEIVRPFAAY